MPGVGANDKWTVRLGAGIVASIVSECLTLPIDTVKVRLQIQGTAANPHTHYKGMLHAFVKIPAEEGFTGLWKGLEPALVRQVYYSSLTMVLYEPIRNLYSPDGSVSFGQKLLAGGTAGSLSLMMANPVEVVKIRMQADAAGTRYRNTIHAFRHILKHEGKGALVNGIIPNMQRGFIVNAVELGVYDQAKFSFMNLGVPDGIACHLCASVVSGVSSAVASTPVDVIKTRLMNQARQSHTIDSGITHYRGMVDCFIKTVRMEGYRALYKGFFPTVFRKVPYCIAFFLSFEKASEVIASVSE